MDPVLSAEVSEAFVHLHEWGASSIDAVPNHTSSVVSACAQWVMEPMALICPMPLSMFQFVKNNDSIHRTFWYFYTKNEIGTF
jgi:hypothetical protein